MFFVRRWTGGCGRAGCLCVRDPIPYINSSFLRSQRRMHSSKAKSSKESYNEDKCDFSERRLLTRPMYQCSFTASSCRHSQWWWERRSHYYRNWKSSHFRASRLYQSIPKGEDPSL